MDADARLDAAVGSVAEEAARLLEALGRPPAPPHEAARADTTSPGASPADDPAPDPATGSQEEHVHVPMGDAQACTWCPVCRSATVLRGLSPETLARLAELATAAAGVLTDLATRHTEDAGAGRSARADRTPRSEPIPVVDEEELT